ncbi:MAG: hypothetical protein ILNGONEN_00196 [Syntrophorhabdaceae bacterium]|nr:hypothetical protein [Syntrophorhabdaceae bacterium]
MNELKNILQKPGPEWTPSEMARILEFLTDPAQVETWIQRAKDNLRGVKTRQNAENVWEQFRADRLDNVLKNWNPSKRKLPISTYSLIHYVAFCLQRYCWDQSPQPIHPFPEDTSMEFEVSRRHQGIDEAIADIDFVKMLLERLEDEHPLHFRVIHMSIVEEVQDAEIVVELGITKNYFHVLKSRGCQYLREYAKEEGIEP